MAAGKGTRLKSKHPKVLHEVGGRPLLAHVIAAAMKVVPAQDVYAIVGHEADRVRQAVADAGINFVLQKEQRGTGHALMVAQEALASYDQVIVLSGDAPLITAGTIERLRDSHGPQQPAMTILTAQLSDPTGYGRVIRKGKNSHDVSAIVEEKSTTPAQRKIREINSGFYAFDAKALFAHLNELSNDNPHGEFYLTDMAEILRRAKKRVMAVEASDPHEILGSNTRAEMVEIDQRMRLAKCMQLLSEGVTIFYPQTCVIDCDVEIGENAHVGNFVETKKTRLGKGSKANHLSYLGDSEIGDGVNIGAGTITCNYDGAHKHTTVIEDGAFIGSDSTLVAPVKIGRDAYVGAASCITDDVPPDSLALGRVKQIVKEGWVKARRASRQTS